MAKENLVAIADRIVRLLQSPAFKELKTISDGSIIVPSIGNVREFSSLEHIIMSVQHLLDGPEFKLAIERDEETIKTFLNNLEDAVHAVDDLLSKMLSEGWRRCDMSAATKVLTFFSLSSSNPLHVNLKLRSKIIKARKKMKEAIMSYNPPPPQASRNPVHDRRGRAYPYKEDEGEVKGRTEDKHLIIELIMRPLLEVEDSVRVIPVVGRQGIGKATLARIIFNDDHIQKDFDLRLWASMDDDDFNTTKIVLRLLESAGVPAPLFLDIDQLQKRFRETIYGKRCFIVLVDMVDHSPQLWSNFTSLLVRHDRRFPVCVLVTTHSEEVAKRICSNGMQIQHLNRLNDEESWALFKKQAFMNIREHEVEKFEEIGRAIAAKCEGVPLSLTVISNILRRNTSVEGWNRFNNDEVIKEEVTNKKGFLPNQNEIAQETRVADAEPRQTHSFGTESKIIGRSDDIEDIVKKLLDQEDDELVIPIVGRGGLGKTTLAQLVFNDEKVNYHFGLKIWVWVTDNFDVRVIVEKMLFSLTPSNPENLELDRLVALLQQVLRRRRYLLVLDDVWNEDREKWKTLRNLLSVGGKGSKIIITTRSTLVAEITSEKPPHKLKELNADESWLMLQREAIVDGEYPTDPNIIQIGIEIAKKCGGVPLVIKTIGSILLSKNHDEWKSFHDNELSTILGGESDVLATLWLSYGDLPSHLKDCFAYCALFPKGYEIDVKTLVNLWTSQGFLDSQGRNHQDLEELGYGYFMDLLRRSFFQETAKDELGKIRRCKIENLMHDLAQNAAGNACASLRRMEGEIEGVLRHVSFDFHLDSSWQIPISLSELKRVRSLILLRQFRLPIENNSRESICDVILKLKLLQTLDLHNSGIKILPDSIGQLMHLCFLDLSHNVSIKSLPNSICRLRNLQILKLSHCSNLQKLPRDIRLLRKLKILENESCYSLTRMPPGLTELLNLQTLSEFVLSKDIASGKLDQLGSLNHLRSKLKIKNLSFPKNDETAKAKLYEKKHLLSLVLSWDIDASVSQANCEKSLEDLRPHPNLKELSLSAYGGNKFPRWLPELEMLVKLTVSRCNRCHCLPPLDHLPKLEVLVVDELMKLEYILDQTLMNKPTTSFPSLRELRLTNLPELKGWWKEASKFVEEESTFTCLSKLVVEDCPNLNSMPMFPCLEELLVLKNSSWAPFLWTVDVVRRRSELEVSSSTTGYPLSKLTTLHIVDMSSGSFRIWNSLPSLISVTLDHLADINVVLERLKEVCLQQLHIWRCDDLHELPSWIGESKSLQTISIKLCPNLKIPREKISLIISLIKVEIEDCPELSHIESMLKDPLYSK